MTTKEAGVIIGKAGKNVAELREQTGVKAGVSKVVQGVHERVLSVSGTVEGVAKVSLTFLPLSLPCCSATNIISIHFPRPKAYSLIISQLLNGAPQSPSAGVPSPQPSHTSLRLLISHNLMGTIIGRSGLKIKAIQDASGARMVASKEMLPQSTERVVEVQGTADGIGRAVEEIGRCLLEDWERGLGTVLFHPGTADERSKDGKRGAYGGERNGNSNGDRRRGNNPAGGDSAPRTNGNGPRANGVTIPAPASASPPSSPTPGTPPSGGASAPQNLRTQNISIPSDMVGCIIGRSGSKITEIRRLSGSKISIAKTPHDETGERMFTIVGTPEANEKALYLLYNQLESEKERRVGREADE